MEQFAALAAAWGAEQEREACAKVCDERYEHWSEKNRSRHPSLQFIAEQGCLDCEHAIRARAKGEA